MEYITLEKLNSVDLDELVNKHLKNGGKLIGGVSIGKDKNGANIWSQAMMIKKN